MYAAAYEHAGLTDQPALRAASNAERINSPAIPRPPIAAGNSRVGNVHCSIGYGVVELRDHPLHFDGKPMSVRSRG